MNSSFFSSDVWEILQKKKFEKFEEIVKQNPNIINSMRGWNERTFLMMAVWQNRFDIFNEVVKFPQDFSLVDGGNGWNILHYVGYYGDVGHLRMLEEKTSFTNLINKESNINKDTPLHWAAFHNKHDVIRWLLTKGANPNVKDSFGQRPDEHYPCDDVTKEIIQSFRSSW